MNTQTKPAPPKVVIAPEGCESYLTAGKQYDVIGFWYDWESETGYGFTILSDRSEICDCLEIKCAHLNINNWIIAEREVSHD